MVGRQVFVGHRSHAGTKKLVIAVIILKKNFTKI